MKELKVFNGMEVEFIVLNDKVLFNAKCVGEILGIVDVNSVVRNFNDKQILKLKNSDVQDTQFRKLNNAGENFLTESGVYKLIMRSNKPEAEQFQDWVTDDLLPTIRKTGGYVVENRAIDFVSNWLPNLDDMSKSVIAGMLEDNQKLRLENTKQKEVIEVQVKEIEYKEDVIIGLVDKITLEEKRQTLNKVVKHKGANYSERWSLLYKHFQDKYHLDLKIRRENWDKVNKPKSKSMVDFIDRGLNKVPELYEIACKLFHSDIEEIVQHYKNLR